MNRVRSGFMGAFCGMLGIVLAGAFLQNTLIPVVIWLAVLALILLYGKADDGR